MSFEPQNTDEYKTIRNDALEAGLEASKVETMDKAAGFTK